MERAVMSNLDSIAYIIPELILCASIFLVLLADIFKSERGGYDAPARIALVGTVFAFLCHFYLYSLAPVELFGGMIAHDPFGVFFRGFVLLCTVLVIAMTVYSREVEYFKKGELYALILCAALGMNLAASSRDMLMAYISLELLSIASYILVAFSRNAPRSLEASMKYILYGSVASGVMLFGLTWLYGLTGATGFTAISEALASTEGGVNAAAYVIFIFILAGIGFKISMVPFHFWAPDVYEGAPTPVTAFLSVASKAAGFALLARIFYSTLLAPAEGGVWIEAGALDIGWKTHIAILAAITMTLGNLAAFPQMNLKRLLAYSGIAHAGYLLMGVAAMSDAGLQAVLFYLAVYLVTNLAAFAVLIIAIESRGDERIGGVREMWRTAPWAAVAMTIALFSLVGLPPTAGFVGKYYIFYAALLEGLVWLAIVGIINTVISLYYYARILKAMYFERAGEAIEARAVHPSFTLLALGLGAAVVYFGIFWEPLARYAQLSAQLLR